MGGALKSVFNPTIAGTGQTAGDLQKIGYTPQDLTTLDPRHGITGGIIKGALGGALGQRQPQGALGGGILQPGPGPASVDPGYFRPQDFGVTPINSAIYGR